MTARHHAALASFVLCASLAHAQAPAPLAASRAYVTGVRDVFSVTGRSATIVEERAPVLPPAPIQALTVPGARWVFPDNGEGWVGRAVALGNHGTQVFTEFDTAADRAVLLSSFDQTPVVAVWNDPVVASSTNVSVHGCDATGLFVSCRQIPLPPPSSLRAVVVSAYSSSSASPLWTWTFPTATAGGSRAQVSRDGSRIVAGMLDPSTLLLHVAVFDGGSSVPTAQWSRQVGTQLLGLTLTEDGGSVYVASSSGGHLFDAATGAVLHQMVLMSSLAAQDVSGDGGVIAVGGFNTVDLWERQPGGGYAHTWQGNWPGPVVCHRLDLSEDGSTLVCALGWYDQNLRVRVEAIDVATKTTTMYDEMVGGGSYQNVPSRVATSSDGRRFAVGLWGDQAGLVPELRVYERRHNAPIATYDYPGSVYDLALSPDGEHVVVGVKSAHANVLAGGGSVDLYTIDTADFDAHGAPSIGRKVDFDLWGAPNAPARLLVAPQLAAQPVVFPSYGVLYLRRAALTIVPMGLTDAQGFATRDYQLPYDPALIGTTLYFQGLTTAPRRFTRDWQQLTLLP